MKKITLLISLVIGLFSVIQGTSHAATPNNNECLIMTGQVYGDGNWKAGDTISVSCEGTSLSINPNPHCPGSTQSGLAPGSSFELNKCSCAGYGADGCLHVNNVPAGCSYEIVGEACGVNGYTIEPSVKLTCTPPPLNCPEYGTQCDDDFACVSDHARVHTCSIGERNGECARGPVEEQCAEGTACESGECKAPPVQPPAPGCPTDTSGCREVSGACGDGGICPVGQRGYQKVCKVNGLDKVCGFVCKEDSTCKQQIACNGTCTGGDSCGGGMSCIAGKCRNPSCATDTDCTCNGGQTPGNSTTPPNPPGNSGTPPVNPPGNTATPPLSCGAPCQNVFDCNGVKTSSGDRCDICRPNSNGNKVCQPPVSSETPPPPPATKTPTNPPTKTPTNPPTKTPTPTPDFNPAMCKCDGITNSALFAGQPAVVTAYGKVEGADTSKAKIQDVTFSLYEGDGTTVKLLQKSQPIASSIASQSGSLVRYQSNWNLVLPPGLKVGQTYRIGAQINCVKQSAQTASTFSVESVASEPTSTVKENKNIFQKFVSLFGGLLGKKPSSNATVTPTPSSGFTTQSADFTTQDERSLQLEPIYPAEVYDKSCTFIKFKFTGNQILERRQ